MPPSSPLQHPDLRAIEKSLDDGNTAEAAALLGSWAHAGEHADAIYFLTTRLLFQRGRIDSHGAADRLGALLERVAEFPEAEEWLHELEARTERTERSSLGSAARDASTLPTQPPPRDPSTLPTQPPPRHGHPQSFPPAATPPPPSAAPSIPRSIDETHPYFDEATLDDDVTPAESLRPGPTSLEDDAPSSHPPFGADNSEPPTSPDARRDLGSEPPPRPGMRSELPDDRPTRPSHMPFDHLRAKEQLSSEAGRYRGPSPSPSEAVGRRSRSPRSRASVAPQGLEQRIRDAFQRIVQGRPHEAFALLSEEPAPPDLRPAARAALARALLEIGQAERAAAEATLALEQAPDSAEARLAFVWSAVRHARQRDDAWSLERASRTLKDLRQNTGPGGALLDALGACIEARVGLPAVALRLAQQAVRVDPDSIDALAALAEAAALCGEERRAEAALERLYVLSESAAEQLAPRLRRLGIGEHGPTSSASVWLPLEHTLSSGAREVALEGIEALADEELARLPARGLGGVSENAGAVARFFTVAPVFRHFGPFDGSLASLERLEVALDLLYGGGPRALEVRGASGALWQLSGQYLGETLRSCCEGIWQPGSDLERARLAVLGVEVQPFQIVRHRIAHGRHATLRHALEAVVALAPPLARRSRSSLELAPTPPWADRAFPQPEELPRLGRALCHSVVAVYALEQARVTLDRTSKSLTALDRYLQLVAPGDAPLDAESGWARWLSVFVGAYLGEVLCKELGGAWRTVDRPSSDAFIIDVGGQQIAPLSLVHAAVSGIKPIDLGGFVADLRQDGETAAR